MRKALLILLIVAISLAGCSSHSSSAPSNKPEMLREMGRQNIANLTTIIKYYDDQNSRFIYILLAANGASITATK